MNYDLTAKQVAAITEVDVFSVRRWIHVGRRGRKLQAAKVLGVWRVSQEALLDFIGDTLQLPGDDAQPAG
jgi:hypothetical protein